MALGIYRGINSMVADIGIGVAGVALEVGSFISKNILF